MRTPPPPPLPDPRKMIKHLRELADILERHPERFRAVILAAVETAPEAGPDMVKGWTALLGAGDPIAHGLRTLDEHFIREHLKQGLVSQPPGLLKQ